MNAAKAISATKNSSVSTGCLIAFGLVFLLGGLVGFWFSCLLPSLRSFQARSWLSTEATITHSKVHESDSGDGTSYEPNIHFSYRVNGQAMESKTWSFSIWSSSETWAGNVVARFPLGSRHNCFFNPRDPARAVLDRSFQWRNLAGLFLLVFAIVGAVVGWHGLRTRQAKLKSDAADSKVPLMLMDSEVDSTPRITSGESEIDQLDPPWKSYEGPQRLKPAMSRTARFIVVLLIALIWNGLAWSIFLNVLHTDGWISIAAVFLTIFVAIGFVVAVGAGYMFLSLFNPVVSIALSNGAIPIGEVVEIAWETAGNAGRISELKIDLVGLERATYTRGTSTYNDSKEFARIPVTQTSDITAMQFGSNSLQIPVGSMHSFAASNNKIEWSIEVYGKIGWWPDVKESMPLAVKPADIIAASNATAGEQVP